MNYRHAFHAGNFADVVKHVTILSMLEYLSRKPRPWSYVETHAGRGLYPLDGPEAMRGGEWREGIGRIALQQDLSPGIEPYARLVGATDGRNIRRYPGSPLLVRRVMRDDDRAILAELQPEEARQLKSLFRGDPQVAVHQTDGYQALKAFLPPNPARGLVLIDPPYESPDELERLPGILAAAAKRWETGIFALWYPIKDRVELRPFMRSLAEMDAGPTLIAELSVAPQDNPSRLNGTGMVILRPPWRLEEMLKMRYTALAGLLGRKGPATFSVRPLESNEQREREDDMPGRMTARY